MPARSVSAVAGRRLCWRTMPPVKAPNVDPACFNLPRVGDDAHVLCVPCSDPGWSALEDVDDLPRQLRAEITHFFTVYKDLDEDRHSEVRGWGTREEALRTVAEARERFASSGDSTSPDSS